VTKERICRLISLAVQREREDGLRDTEDVVTYNDLLMQFEAWQPPDLRHLLEMAEEVGYAQREWRESEEQGEECQRHPYYRKQADTDKLYYEQLRATLYAAAGLPETEEVPPEKDNAQT
jgi:hypothetical protein